MLNDIFIYPIELFLKFIFEVSFLFSHSYILATIILSFVVFIATLPFYYWAEKFQKEERNITQRLKPKIDEFKSVYNGSKLHAVTSTLYRQNNYHPIFALRSVAGLAIQLPFFIAAYHLLSTYQPIIGVETWLFKDLGAPDGWIDIGSFQINVMPLIMTAVNLVSGFIFTRGMSKSEEIQVWVLAVVFLVLLYASPALLVLYWTMNNIFSLLKNIIEKKLKSESNSSDIQIKEENNYLQKVSSRAQSIISYIPFGEVISVILVLYIYLIGIIHVAPDGINKVFAIKLKQTILYIPLVIIFFIGISSSVFHNVRSFRFQNLEMSKKSDLLLIFLPLTPIIQYMILNQGSLTVYGSLYIIIIAIFCSVVIIISLPVLLSVLGSRILFISLGLALLTLLFYMPSLTLSQEWHSVGSSKIQWSILLILFFVSHYMYKKKDKLLKLIIFIFFIVNTGMTFLGTYTTVPENLNVKYDNPIINDIINLPMVDKPNIYLLTYDAYVGNETMKHYGIDNSSQEQYLKENGFKIYNGVYSVASTSKQTMERVLNMSSSYFGKNQYIAGNGSVYNILKQQGYNTGIVMNDAYFFEQKLPLTDFYYPKKIKQIRNGHKIILTAILEGEFSFDTEKSSLQNLIDEKRKYMYLTDKPQFMYTHTGPHHSQNSGRCLQDEIEQFQTRLIKSNQEMKDDVDTILKNDPNALIIINGDHGPYLTRNCTNLSNNDFLSKDKVSRLDIQDRFGAFLAIKWSKSSNIIDENLTVLQDVFPAVFATLVDDKSIFEKLKVKPITDGYSTSGAKVNNGIIMDGLNKGEQLFYK